MSTWHIVRASDKFYAQTVQGTQEDAEKAAADYRPNPWTERGLAYAVPAEADYPATVQARRSYGDSYGDYIQRSLAEELVTRGVDRREARLGFLLMGNDGD